MSNWISKNSKELVGMIIHYCADCKDALDTGIEGSIYRKEVVQKAMDLYVHVTVIGQGKMIFDHPFRACEEQPGDRGIIGDAPDQY